MQSSKTKTKSSKNSPHNKGKTIALLLITLFGVFFLSGMGLTNNDFFGAGLLGGQMWFFWSVVTFIIILLIVFSAIVIRWEENGLSNATIRSLHLYCWALLFVSSFVIGLQSATFGALNAQVVNLGFVAFGNIFSSIWVLLMALITGTWIYANTANRHLDEAHYKVLRNYFFWIIAFSLFIFHFEQASSGALGVDTEKMLLNTDLGDTITSKLTNGIMWADSEGFVKFTNFLAKIIYDKKDWVINVLNNNGLNHKADLLDKARNWKMVAISIRKDLKEYKDFFIGNESAIVFGLITILFGKGAFWGLNNSWSGWTIFLTVILGTIGITTYAYDRYRKNDVHNVDNPFFVLTPLCIIVFTIFMYSLNAYVITFINGGHLNPGIVGSHIGHLQQDIPANATILQIIQAHWMFQILKYPVGDVFAGTYHGTWWWWTEWTISLVGITAIIFGSWTKYEIEIKKDYAARKKAKQALKA